MSGPEFTGVGAVYGWLGALPAPLAGGALAVLILIGMGACTAAWIDYQDYTPLPNICRAEQLGSLAQQSGSCVPATPAQSGVVGHG
ncbi:hypothetical protein DMB37_29135 [Nocardia sp. CS682]|nr:hypothetical protein DMB37_29135 [Nocardia sp. CS682]